VRALSEGTRRMRDEMKRSGLPAPIYKMSEFQTMVILFNDLQERGSGSQIPRFTSIVAPSLANVDKIKPLSNPLLPGIICVIVGGGLVASGMILGKNFAELPSRTIVPLSSNSNDNLVVNKKKLAPDTFIRNYYKLLQDRQLDKSWDNLSAIFKASELVKGFQEYKEWWNSVDSIKIIDVQILEESLSRAVVKAELVYSMKNGKKIPDNNRYFYLVYHNGEWLIDKKSETYVLVSH
jgi:hypothetical protein